MIRHGATLALLLMLLNTSRAIAGERKEDRSSKRSCEPIGRVLTKGDPQLIMGSWLCTGDQLQLPPGVVVDVLCFVNREILSLPRGLVANGAKKCVSAPKNEVRTSSHGRGLRYKPKGPSDGLLTKPYGKRLMDGRPLLSWVAIPGANNYTVKASGLGVNWQETVKTTELPYPDPQPAMKPGYTYKITVLAHQETGLIEAGESVVNMISQGQIQQLKTMFKRIDALKLPEDEAAFLDFDAIYMSENLLNGTIENLETRVKAGSHNPGLYRVLGDRYLEAGVPTKAQASYKKATQLAQADANLQEYHRAKVGLIEVARYSQLPTKINPAQ